MACEADGVHLGQEDLGLDDARSIVGNSMLIGISTHSLEQAIQAEQGVRQLHRLWSDVPFFDEKLLRVRWPGIDRTGVSACAATGVCNRRYSAIEC